MKHKSGENHKFLSLGRKKSQELFLKEIMIVAVRSVTDATETIILTEKHSNLLI